MRSSLVAGVLAALSVLYVVAELVPGRFIGTDEVFFKAAGRNWAATGHFAAPEITGRLQGGPPLNEIYFAQPPLYTFVFGVYTKLAGFGPRRCIFFDTLIHLLLVWSAVFCAKEIFALPCNLAALCGILFLPLGTAGRPDELAIVFGFVAAVALRPSRFLGGVLLGLCAATSLSAIVFLGPLVLWEFLFVREPTSRGSRSLLIVFMGAISSVALCVLPILLRYPSAYQQLLVHAGVQSRVLGAITGVATARGKYAPSFTAEFLRPWRIASTYGFGYVFLILGIFAFAFASRAAGAKGTAARQDRFVAAGILLALLAVVFPGKFFYLWYFSAWLLIASVALAANVLKQLSPLRRASLLSLAVSAWLIGAFPYVRERAILWALPRDQSLTANLANVRRVVPPGARVLTTDFWWALADRDLVYDAMFSSPPTEELNYVVLSGNGSGVPGIPLVPNPALFRAAEFRLVRDDLNLSRPALLGVPLSRSAYGFGAFILRRAAPSTR